MSRHCAVRHCSDNLTERFGAYISGGEHAVNACFGSLVRYDISVFVKFQLPDKKIRCRLSAYADEHRVTVNQFFVTADNRPQPR